MTREEFKIWLEERAEDYYHHLPDVKFKVNNHTISTKSNECGHIVIDGCLVGISYPTCVINNITMSSIEYTLKKCFE